MTTPSHHGLDSTVLSTTAATANLSHPSLDGSSPSNPPAGGALVGHLDGTFSYVDLGSPPSSQIGMEANNQGINKNPKARKKTSLSLTYGMIRFKWITPSKASASSPVGSDEDTQHNASAEIKKRKPLPVFDLVNRHMAKPIQLYGNQMLRLIEELPTAYEAFYSADDGYRFELVKTKDQLVTLEVSLYNNKTYLFLKKYFKPEDCWVPTKSMLSFDPDADDSDKMLDFYADCCQ